MSKSILTLTNLRRIWHNRIPPQVIVQLTDRCNARCPQCGMRATEQFRRSTLERDTVKRIIDAAAEKGVAALSFTGGEPLLMIENLTEYIRHAGRAGIPYVRTGTNGHFLRNPEAPDFFDRVRRVADTLADTPLRNFWISVDSAVAEVHEQMRGFPGLIEGIRKALPLFHERGIYPAANLGVNRNIGGAATSDLRPSAFADEAAYLSAFHHQFRNGLDRFYTFVEELGFTMVNTCYPMSLDAPESEAGLEAAYAATTTDRVVRFSRREKAMLFKALLDTVPQVRPRIRVFSPLVSLYALYRQAAGFEEAPYACRGGIDFFFIMAADGNTYPCGYRGRENLGPFWDLDLDRLDTSQRCTACDWECFRDPSELIGPFLQGFAQPWALARKFLRDPDYFRLWRQDLRYQRACDFFDGRIPPTPDSLREFEGRRFDLHRAALPALQNSGG